jgi:4-amino-4-deoxy-L-arabinose transferase-like glycosyltransferase
VTAVSAAVFAAAAVAGLAAAAVRPLTERDALSIYGRKAEWLAQLGHLDPSLFANPAYSMMQPDYPLLLPLLEGMQYRAGGIDMQLVHVQGWLLVVAFAGALGFVGRRWLGNPLYMLAPAAVLVLPGVLDQALTAYADVPMAAFLALGALLMAIWLERGERTLLVLGVILLAGAAATKNEGLIGAVICVAACAAALLARRAWGPLRALAFAAACMAAALSPWWIWIRANGIHSDLKPSHALDPAFLAGRLGRVRPAAETLLDRLASGTSWAFLVPLGVAVCVAHLGWDARPARGRGPVPRTVAAFWLACVVLFLAALVWTYWTSPHDLEWHLESTSRVVTAPALLSLVALLHLGSRAFALDRTASRA